MFYDILFAPIGPLLLLKSQKGICGVHFLKGNEDEQTAMEQACPGIMARKSFIHLKKAGQELMDYFTGCRMEFSLLLDINGTAFQKNVWRAMRTIPYGETRSYLEIAALAGNPLAARAVGMACRQNPIAILIPCHRVIGKNGNLTGFGGGLKIKENLLQLEQKRRRINPGKIKTG